MRRYVDCLVVGSGMEEVIDVLRLAEPGDVFYINGYDSSYMALESLGETVWAERRGRPSVNYVATSVEDPDGRLSPVLSRVGHFKPHWINQIGLIET